MCIRDRGVFGGDLSKYQDRLLKAIGLDEQQSQAVSALVNTAGAVGVPLVGGVKTKLKGIAQRKRDRVKQSQDERAKELKEGKAKSRGKTEPSERIPEDRIPQRDTRALQEDLRGADGEFGGGDVNIPEAEPTHHNQFSHDQLLNLKQEEVEVILLSLIHI